MSQIQVSVTVEKETNDLIAALVKVIGDAKAALKGGLTGLALDSAIATAVIADLAPVISEAIQIPADLKESAEASAAAVLVQVPALLAILQA